jgi:hypothetical protein
MGILGSLLKRFFRKEPSLDLKEGQGIVLRPDGSWIVAPEKRPPPITSFAPPKIITQMPSIPRARWWEDIPNATSLNSPPDYFPHGHELFSKLEQCLDMDIIDSCSHIQTENNVYLLRIELPCDKNSVENMRRFKMFIKAMEEVYHFKTIQQERLNSTTSCNQHYLVVFEYDPKRFILKKVKDTETKE